MERLSNLSKGTQEGFDPGSLSPRPCAAINKKIPFFIVGNIRKCRELKKRSQSKGTAINILAYFFLDFFLCLD